MMQRFPKGAGCLLFDAYFHGDDSAGIGASVRRAGPPWWRNCSSKAAHSRRRDLPWTSTMTLRHAGGACASSRRVLSEGGHRDTPGEDARNPRCYGEAYLALPPGRAFAHDRGVRLALLEGVHAVQAPPLGRAEGGMPVLWECVVWHHPGLSRLPGLDLVYPESPSLCPACDGAKVAALQRPYRIES